MKVNEIIPESWSDIMNMISSYGGTEDDKNEKNKAALRKDLMAQRNTARLPRESDVDYQKRYLDAFNKKAARLQKIDSMQSGAERDSFYTNEIQQSNAASDTAGVDQLAKSRELRRAWDIAHPPTDAAGIEELEKARLLKNAWDLAHPPAPAPTT